MSESHRILCSALCVTSSFRAPHLLGCTVLYSVVLRVDCILIILSKFQPAVVLLSGLKIYLSCSLSCCSRCLLSRRFWRSSPRRQRYATEKCDFSLKKTNYKNIIAVSPSLKVHDSMLGEFACLMWCLSVLERSHPSMDGSNFQCRNGWTSLWHSRPLSLDAVVYRDGCLILTCPHTSLRKTTL